MLNLGNVAIPVQNKAACRCVCACTCIWSHTSSSLSPKLSGHCLISVEDARGTNSSASLQFHRGPRPTTLGYTKVFLICVHVCACVSERQRGRQRRRGERGLPGHCIMSLDGRLKARFRRSMTPKHSLMQYVFISDCTGSAAWKNIYYEKDQHMI